jgi:hypothetical protein
MDMKNIMDSDPSLSLKTHDDSVVAIVHNTSHNYGSSLSGVVLSSFLEYLCP